MASQVSVNGRPVSNLARVELAPGRPTTLQGAHDHPGRFAGTALYLGSGGTRGWGTGNGGQGLSPLLLHVTQPLASGTRLHDAVVGPPQRRARFLVAIYDPAPRPGHDESGGEVARSVAELSVKAPAA